MTCKLPQQFEFCRGLSHYSTVIRRWKWKLTDVCEQTGCVLHESVTVTASNWTSHFLWHSCRHKSCESRTAPNTRHWIAATLEHTIAWKLCSMQGVLILQDWEFLLLLRYSVNPLAKFLLSSHCLPWEITTRATYMQSGCKRHVG